MGFKELDQVQIDCLNSEEKERYQREYKIYKQRVEFVEKMSGYQHIDAISHRPAIDDIFILEQVPEIKFETQDHIVKTNLKAYKPTFQTNIQIDSTIDVSVPQCTTQIEKNYNVKIDSKLADVVLPKQMKIEFEKTNNPIEIKINNIKIPENKKITSPVKKKIEFEEANVILPNIVKCNFLYGNMKRNMQVEPIKYMPKLNKLNIFDARDILFEDYRVKVPETLEKIHYIKKYNGVDKIDIKLSKTFRVNIETMKPYKNIDPLNIDIPKNIEVKLMDKDQFKGMNEVNVKIPKNNIVEFDRIKKYEEINLKNIKLPIQARKNVENIAKYVPAKMDEIKIPKVKALEIHEYTLKQIKTNTVVPKIPMVENVDYSYMPIKQVDVNIENTPVKFEKIHMSNIQPVKIEKIPDVFHNDAFVVESCGEMVKQFWNMRYLYRQ